MSRPFEMVVVTEDDFRAMCNSPRTAVEGIIQRVRGMDVEGLCAWAVQLMRVDRNQDTSLLHAFLLTAAIERHEQLGYEMQNAGERS